MKEIHRQYFFLIKKKLWLTKNRKEKMHFFFQMKYLKSHIDRMIKIIFLCKNIKRHIVCNNIKEKLKFSKKKREREYIVLMKL